MNEKLKALKKQLDEATGAENVLLNVVDMDMLLTVAMTSAVDPDVLDRFGQAMERAARQNQVQKLGLNRLIRRTDTANTYLGALTEKEISEIPKTAMIKIRNAQKALAGQFDQ